MRVAIIGGGIAGLATAYYLQEGAREAGVRLDCTVLERDGRFGGKVVTDRRDGFVVEGGPDCFLTQKPWALELIRRLGMEDRLLPTNEASRKVFIVWKGRLRQLPEGVLLIVPTRFRPFIFSTLISPLAKLRMGLDIILPRRKETGDESVASFVRRRLGQEALDKIAEPLMGGIHVSDPERQSLLASFPRFAEIERKHRSLILGMLAARRSRSARKTRPLPQFMTMREGLGELIEGLVGKLDGVSLRLNSAVAAVSRDETGTYHVALEGGESLGADAVVLATPAYVTASLVEGLDPALADRLRAIRYVTTATVSFGFRRRDISNPLNGFGLVIPCKEGRLITGCTWSSTKFDNRAPADHVLVRCFLGGAVNEEPALLPEAEMVRIAREEMRELMGIGAEPVLTQVYRWSNGHPQYDVGHLDRMAELDRHVATHPGLHLIGSSYRGVGLPDCIRSGALAADAILKATASAESGLVASR